jgi:hypothetical protein
MKSTTSNSNMPAVVDVSAFNMAMPNVISNGLMVFAYKTADLSSAGTVSPTMGGGTNAGQMITHSYNTGSTTRGFSATTTLSSNAGTTTYTGLTNAISTMVTVSGGNILMSNASAVPAEVLGFVSRRDVAPTFSQSDMTGLGIGSQDVLRLLISFWRSQFGKADAKFSSLVREIILDESENESFKEELARFLDKFGNAGMQVVLNRLLRDGISTEIRHLFLLAIAKIEDDQTISERRSLLARAIRSTDASVRYSASVALGLLASDPAARSALVDQKQRERNPAVRKMIQAQLA